MSYDILVGIIIFLLGVIGFFFKSLIKALEETKTTLNDIKNALTEHITRQEYIEKKVERNEIDILALRERCHEIGNILNGVKGRLDLMDLNNEN